MCGSAIEKVLQNGQKTPVTNERMGAMLVGARHVTHVIGSLLAQGEMGESLIAWQATNESRADVRKRL